MRNLKRVLFGLFVLLSVLFCPRILFGDDGELICVTPEVAVEQAQAFFNDVSEESVTACDPIKMVNIEGKPVGYIVRAKRHGMNYGYVVFDSERNWWVSEYCLEPNAITPIEATNEEVALLASQDVVFAVKFDDLSFGVTDLDKGIVAGLEDGSSIKAHSIEDNFGGSPEIFDDVFVSPKDLYKQGYVIEASKTISGMITPTQSEVIRETKTYACEVSAMFAVCSHYVTLNRLKLPDLYSELWNLSGTTDEGLKYDEVTGLFFTQGGTGPDRAAPAIKEFCSKRGKNVNTSFAWYPSWDSFRSNTDSGNLSIFSGRLISSGEGHAMAVAGYAAMRNTYTSDSKYLLVVWDGWTKQLRFLPYDVKIYTAHDGTYCKG